MSEKDWLIAQNRDPVIRNIKYLMNKREHMGRKVYLQAAPCIKQYLR